MIVLALINPSVMALVAGGVIGAAARLILMFFFLPGPSNRFHWERAAGTELITFGKWIFLSTLCWFFASQGDKAVLGKFLTLESLGIYNIGYFLASFPLLLGQNVTSRVMIPVFREGTAPERVMRMRYALSIGIGGLLVVMALIGPWLAGTLYDARYISSGAIIVVLSVGLIPQVIGITYDQAALAAGDSRRFFVCAALRSVMQVGLLLIGAIYAGLIGALVGMALASALSHVVLIWLARVHDVWDMRHDLLFTVLWVIVSVLSVRLHWDAIVAMVSATG
jgi:O-antigen/teichoic acid export membrane protein